ncbi:MAG: polyamine aminopropyltransferase [Clostridiales bacterium]|jgi:spermidine synthase|nr:polyamine aminopropyltransferase [Clostridiales bacterium]
MREWFYEEQTPSTRIAVEIRKILHEEQSQFQNIKIIDTIQFGRMLALDDVIQVTELDEFAYHEMLSHVPLHAHANPESVLVVGGGDGGMVREVSKHDSVKRVVLAEIDEAVVNASINHVPSFSVALKDNPKLEIRIGDAIEYVKNLHEEFDVIIVDSSDPVGFAEGLFSREFYGNVHKALRPGGMVTIQGESPWYKYRPMIKRICGWFGEIFPISKQYWANVPSYPSGVMLFPVGSKGNDPAIPIREPVCGLRYYSKEIHKASFVLPLHLQVEQMEEF